MTVTVLSPRQPLRRPWVRDGSDCSTTQANALSARGTARCGVTGKQPDVRHRRIEVSNDRPWTTVSKLWALNAHHSSTMGVAKGMLRW